MSSIKQIETDEDLIRKIKEELTADSIYKSRFLQAHPINGSKDTAENQYTNTLIRIVTAGVISVLEEKIEDLHDIFMAELAMHNIEKHGEEVLDYDKFFDKEEE